MRVTLLAAQSLDGFITHHGRPGSDFTSPADKAYFSAALRGFDCCVMGRGTYTASRHRLNLAESPRRRRVVLTREPEKFAAEAVPEALEFSNDTAAALVARLRAEGRRACALLGGAQVNSLFLAAGLVDEVWLTAEPRLFGGGTPLLAAPADVRLELLAHEVLDGGALLAKYAVGR